MKIMNRMSSQATETAQSHAVYSITPKLLKHGQQHNHINWIPFGFIAFLTAHMALSGTTWTAPLLHGVVHLATIIYYSRALWREPPSFLTRRRKRWLLLGVCLIAIALLVSTFCLPASAQFYGAAEAFFQSSFPQAATAIPLLFNALRGIFIIYVAIALVAVLNAFRQGEDWLTVARTPAVVVVVVALGDVLTVIIIG
jgi:hypothetical protein